MEAENNTGREAEVLTSELARNTFLSLWSFPNVHKVAGGQKTRLCKEVCDLLIVFGDIVAIVSIKHSNFKSSSSIEVAWNRWKQRAVAESIKQIRGAEAHISREPQNLFLDSKCQTRLPVALPPLERRKTFRIAVALGARKACMDFFQGGSGSLKKRNYLPADPVDTRDPFQTLPFIVEEAFNHGSGVHILDEYALHTLLAELNTAKDFFDYLEKKEEFLKTFPAQIPGEEEILARYWRHIGPDGRHDLPRPPHYAGVRFDEGLWNATLQSQQYRERQIADEPSFLVDRLIEWWTKVWRKGKLGTQTERFDLEAALRSLAVLSRIERRLLEKLMWSQIESTQPGKVHFGATYPWGSDLRMLIFISVRDARYSGSEILHLLDMYSDVTKLKYPNVQEIIGIGTKCFVSDSNSDVMLRRDLRRWSEEDNRRAVEVSQELGLMSHVNFSLMTEQEFPMPK